MKQLQLIAGTWKANLSKSQRDPNHQFQSLTVHVEVSDEAVLLSFTGVNLAGEQVAITRKRSQYSGRDAEHPMHMAREMALVGEAGLNRYLADRELTLAEKILRSFHPPPDHVLMRRQSYRLPEEDLEVGHAETNYRGKVAK
jgi:hypothetical protein